MKCHPEIETYELAREPMLSLPGLEIYPSKRKVFRDRQEIQLTTKEYEILLLLASNKGHVLTYNQIMRRFGEIAHLVVKATPLVFHL